MYKINHIYSTINDLRKKKVTAPVFFIIGENQKMNFTYGHIVGLRNKGATVIQSSLLGWFYWDVNVLKEVVRIRLPEHLQDLYEDPDSLKYVI